MRIIPFVNAQFSFRLFRTETFGCVTILPRKMSRQRGATGNVLQKRSIINNNNKNNNKEHTHRRKRETVGAREEKNVEQKGRIVLTLNY